MIKISGCNLLSKRNDNIKYIFIINRLLLTVNYKRLLITESVILNINIKINTVIKINSYI